MSHLPGHGGEACGFHEAKTHLPRLIERPEAGEEVVIARGETPVVRLVPVAAPRVERRFRSDGGKGDRIGRLSIHCREMSWTPRET